MANTRFSREAPEAKVFIDGAHEPLLHPLSIEWSVGGKSLDFAELGLDHGKSRQHREEFRKWVGGKFYDAHEVKIILTINGREETAHVGRLAVMKPEVDESTERLTFISRLDNWHFGKPLVGIKCFSPGQTGKDNPNEFGSAKFDDQNEFDVVDFEDLQEVLLHDKVVFNPDRDGTVYGSKLSATDFKDALLFVPANLIEPAGDAAQPYPGVALWELNDVILYLCQTLNLKEEVIANPTKNQLETWIGNIKGLIRNVKLRQGRYLNQVLDDVLEPLGYSWFLDYQEDKPTIRVYWRPDGVGAGIGEAEVKAMLRIPENADEDSGFPLNLEKMNVVRLNLQIDKSAAVNEVGVLGDFVEVEATFELRRAWSEDKDELINDSSYPLTKSVAGDLGDNINVWRKWVLNETGEYNGLRPEIKEAFNFNNEFGTGEWTESRRRFLPTITTGENGEPIGPSNGFLVEVLIEELSGGAQRWETVEANFRILEDECAIYFDDEEPPSHVTYVADIAVIRITATVRGDRKIGALAERKDDAENPDKVREVVQAPGRFKRRIVSGNSSFSGTEGAGVKATDDKDKILAYAEALRDSVQRVHTSGTIAFEGVEPPFKNDQGRIAVGLGFNVKEIEGAGIKLGSLADRDARPFPTVVGITMDFQKQRTVATLESFGGRLPE